MAGQDRAHLSVLAVASTSFTIAGAGLTALAVYSLLFQAGLDFCSSCSAYLWVVAVASGISRKLLTQFGGVAS